MNRPDGTLNRREVRPARRHLWLRTDFISKPQAAHTSMIEPIKPVDTPTPYLHIAELL